MWKVTIRGLLAHKLRFALTALAVMLGVAFMSGTMVLTDTIQRTFDELFADVNRGTDAYVRGAESVAGQRNRVSAGLVDVIDGVDGVEAVQPELQFYAQLVDDDGDAIGNPEMGAPTFGFNWNEVEELNPFRIEGDGRSPRGVDEVVIDRASADDAGFDVGDDVTVLTEQAPKVYEIVGIAKFGGADSPAGASVALFSTAEALRITGTADQFDAIRVLGAGGLSQGELRDRIAVAVGDAPVEVLTGAQITREDQNDIAEGFAFFEIALLVFAGISLFVACFIIFNTFSVVVAQRTREMALLRAVGARGRQVMLSVLGESVLVGLVASVAGLISGILLASVLKALLDAFGFDIPGGSVVVRTTTVVAALGVGSVVTVASAIAPARRAAKVAPIAALRDVAVEPGSRWVRRGLAGTGTTLLGLVALLVGLFVREGTDGLPLVGFGAFLVFLGVTVLGPLIARPVSRVLGWPVQRLKGLTGALARENAMRNPKRTSATAAALMIGVAIVGFFTVFAASAKRTLDVQIDRAFGSDFVINSGGGFGFGGFSPELAGRVAELPEVSEASGLRFNEARIDGSNQFLVAFDPVEIDALFDLDPQVGEFADLGADGIAVSDEAADDHGWRLGSKVPVVFPAGGERDLTVQTIYGFGLQEGLSDYAISLDAYQLGYTEQLDNQVYVTLAAGASPRDGERALEQVIEDFPTARVQDRTEFKDSAAGMINQILALIYVLLFLAVLIALIGIANTLALSVHERTRELGLLRAVGMSRRQLRSAVRWESVIIAVLGTVLGLAIGVFFGWAIIRALREEGFELFAAPPFQLAIIVVAAALAGVLAAAGPARRAARLDVLRAIHAE